MKIIDWVYKHAIEIIIFIYTILISYAIGWSTGFEEGLKIYPIDYSKFLT